MTDAHDLIVQLIRWDGDRAAAADWIRPRMDELHLEASGASRRGPAPRLVGDTLDLLVERLSDDAAAGDARDLDWEALLSPRECAVIAFHKLWSFLGSAARQIGESQLWNDLIALFNRYARTLQDIAGALRATGLSLSVRVPLGFDCGLEFTAVES